MFARYWYICPRMFVTHFFRNVAVKIFDILFSSLIKSLPLSISLSISTNFTTSDLSPLSLYFSLPPPYFQLLWIYAPYLYFYLSVTCSERTQENKTHRWESSSQWNSLHKSTTILIHVSKIILNRMIDINTICYDSTKH